MSVSGRVTVEDGRIAAVVELDYGDGVAFWFHGTRYGGVGPQRVEAAAMDALVDAWTRLRGAVIRGAVVATCSPEDGFSVEGCGPSERAARAGTGES